MGNSAHRLSIRRIGVTGGTTTALVFILCWIGTFIPFSSPTHAFIGLFSPEETQSIAALLEGTLWSLLFGALSGVLFAVIYNATAALERR
jgi:hypothetical protein